MAADAVSRMTRAEIAAGVAASLQGAAFGSHAQYSIAPVAPGARAQQRDGPTCDGTLRCGPLVFELMRDRIAGSEIG
jgi:hypothetical protein